MTTINTTAEIVYGGSGPGRRARVSPRHRAPRRQNADVGRCTRLVVPRTRQRLLRDAYDDARPSPRVLTIIITGIDARAPGPAMTICVPSIPETFLCYARDNRNKCTPAVRDVLPRTSNDVHYLRVRY